MYVLEVCFTIQRNWIKRKLLLKIEAGIAELFEAHGKRNELVQGTQEELGRAIKC